MYAISGGGGGGGGTVTFTLVPYKYSPNVSCRQGELTVQISLLGRLVYLLVGLQIPSAREASPIAILVLYRTSDRNTHIRIRILQCTVLSTSTGSSQRRRVLLVPESLGYYHTGNRAPSSGRNIPLSP